MYVAIPIDKNASDIALYDWTQLLREDERLLARRRNAGD